MHVDDAPRPKPGSYFAPSNDPCYEDVVGHVSVTATVTARWSTRARFLVDSGATHTIVPPSLAQQVGAPTLPRRFVVSLADGRRRLKACSVGVRVAGRTGPTIALILPGAEPLLGVETLEALGLKVNPDKRRLEPSRAQTALLVGVLPRPREH